MTMAVDSSCQNEHLIRECLDGNGDVSVDCSSLKLHEPRIDDLNNQFPLEIPPILFEEASHLAGSHSSHVGSFYTARDVYSISMLPEEDGSANCASPLAFLSILEVPNQAKSSMCLDAHINCQNCVDVQMESSDVFSQCVIDIPSVNGNPVLPESFEDGVESFKTGNSPTSVLWRESSLKVGAKLMQSLVNVSNQREPSKGTDKPVTEKVVHDMPINKWRRYKRSASFDSRKVALLFSILSSLGTLVLIYLTLRVRVHL